MKKLSLIASGLIVAGTLIGCGGGDTVIVKKEGLTGKEFNASDAYVADLKYIKVGDENISREKISIDGKTGKITFYIRDFNPNAIITIPKEDTIVDIDLDGEVDDFDQEIRMKLKTKGLGTVANPIGTAAIVKGDTDLFKEYSPYRGAVLCIIYSDFGVYSYLLPH